MTRNRIKSLPIKEAMFFPEDFKRLRKSVIIVIKEGELLWQEKKVSE